MTDFNILITQVKVQSVKFEIDSESKKLDWNCIAALCTDDGRKVTEVSMGSNSWHGKDQIKFPDSLAPLVKRFFDMATPMIADKIMNRFTLLTTQENTNADII